MTREQPLSCDRPFDPRGAASNDGLATTRSLLAQGTGTTACGSVLDEVEVVRLERRVPAEGGRKGSGVERTPEPAAATRDMGLARPQSALLDKRREAGERGSPFPADPAQVRQAQQQREGGTLADPGYDEHESEAPSQVAVALMGGDQASQFVGARPQVFDIRRHHGAQVLIRIRSWRAVKRAMSASIFSMKVN